MVLPVMMTLKPFVNSSESWNTWSASWAARCFNHWRESSFPGFAMFYNLQFNYDCLTSVQELQIVPINVCSLFITTAPCLLRNSLCFQFKEGVFEKKNMGIRWVQNSANSSRDNKMFQIWVWYARLNCSYAKELPGIQNKNRFLDSGPRGPLIKNIWVGSCKIHSSGGSDVGSRRKHHFKQVDSRPAKNILCSVSVFIHGEENSNDPPNLMRLKWKQNETFKMRHHFEKWRLPTSARHSHPP